MDAEIYSFAFTPTGVIRSSATMNQRGQIQRSFTHSSRHTTSIPRYCTPEPKCPPYSAPRPRWWSRPAIACSYRTRPILVSPASSTKRCAHFQDLQQARHPFLTIRRHCIDHRPSDAHGSRTQSYSFEHIRSSSDTAIDEYLELGTSRIVHVPMLCEGRHHSWEQSQR